MEINYDTHTNYVIDFFFCGEGVGEIIDDVIITFVYSPT